MLTSRTFRVMPFVVAVSLLGAGLLNAASASAVSPSACTIIGTPKADVLRGTSGSDVICGLGGNDTLLGGDGNDTLLGGDGNDKIDAGAGNDIVSGEAGNDSLVGGAGNDTLSGGKGADVISAGAGNDIVSGDDGNDQVNGGDGNDRLSGNIGDDRVSGDSGTDTLWGNAGGDALSGGIGNDALQGGAGPDRLTAGTGTDQCAVDGEDTVTGRCLQDSAGPRLTVDYAPAMVSAGETVTFRWRGVDASGVALTMASIGGPSGWVTTWCGFQTPGTRVSGDDRDGLYTLECVIPANAPSQSGYTIFISGSDNFGNAAPGVSSDFTVTGGSSDTSSPEVRDVQVLGGMEPGSTFTLRSRAIDESGVKYAYAWINYKIYSVVDPATMRLFVDYVSSPELVEGDEYDGVWEQKFSIREDTPAGVYTIWFSIGDTVGNRQYQQTSYTVTVLP